MSKREHHLRLRPSVVMALALSCAVVCAAAVGAFTGPVVVVSLCLAAAVGAVSLHEQAQDRADPFSVSSRPQVGAVTIEAPRARQATQHSDVA